MNVFAFAFLAGLVLTVAVFGSLLWLSDRVARAVVAPGSRFPFIPRLIGGIIAVGATFPIVLWVVGSTPLESLPWGHAGEALWPGLFGGFVLTLLARKWRTPSAKRTGS